ncbi:MAG: hypothetical protein HEP71_34290 [Roseivirga sp.]|nr:hypothetical protein [Roseivirga sp.]
MHNLLTVLLGSLAWLVGFGLALWLAYKLGQRTERRRRDAEQCYRDKALIEKGRQEVLNQNQDLIDSVL